MQLPPWILSVRWAIPKNAFFNSDYFFAIFSSEILIIIFIDHFEKKASPIRSSSCAEDLLNKFLNY
jgi:hypothetical protein